MTVAELIAKLQEMPPYAQVLRWLNPGDEITCTDGVDDVELNPVYLLRHPGEPGIVVIS